MVHTTKRLHVALAAAVVAASVLVPAGAASAHNATPGNVQLHPFLVCVRRHESDRSVYPYTRGYRAKNPRSTASGAYQFLNSSWRVLSKRAGYPGWRRAMDAPPAVQDAVAYWTLTHYGKSPWRGTGC